MSDEAAKTQGNPGQVGKRKFFLVALIEPERGALIGLLDSRSKKFLVLPSADMPIGDVSKLCKYDNMKHDTRTTVYMRQADAQADRILMMRAIQQAGSKEYQSVLMPLLAKE